MPDQAAGLRSLFARRRPSLLIVAGSDPCKAAVATHFARQAATDARATLLVDGTAGQIALVCDVPCRYELAHVLAGDLPLDRVLRPLTSHLLLLPAARALARFGSFTDDEEARLVESFSQGMADALMQGGASDAQIDLIVVNAAEGHAMRAIEAFGRDARVVIVASDRPASLRGAYVEMKALTQAAVETFEIVSPRFEEAAPVGVAFANLAAAARRFLEIEIVDGGTVLLSPPASDPPASTLHALSEATEPSAAHASLSSSHPSNVEVPHAAVA